MTDYATIIREGREFVPPGWFFPAKISSLTAKLIVSLLHFDPSQRITAAEALQHPWCLGSTTAAHSASSSNLPPLRQPPSPAGDQSVSMTATNGTSPPRYVQNKQQHQEQSVNKQQQSGRSQRGDRRSSPGASPNLTRSTSTSTSTSLPSAEEVANVTLSMQNCTIQQRQSSQQQQLQQQQVKLQQNQQKEEGI